MRTGPLIASSISARPEANRASGRALCAPSHALKEAYTLPLRWWNRIVATSSKLKGWDISPDCLGRTSQTSVPTSETAQVLSVARRS